MMPLEPKSRCHELAGIRTRRLVLVAAVMWLGGCAQVNDQVAKVMGEVVCPAGPNQRAATALRLGRYVQSPDGAYSLVGVDCWDNDTGRPGPDGRPDNLGTWQPPVFR